MAKRAENRAGLSGEVRYMYPVREWSLPEIRERNLLGTPGRSRGTGLFGEAERGVHSAREVVSEDPQESGTPERSRGAGIFGEVEGASSVRGGRRSARDSEEEVGRISGKVNRE
jgi:hypothetical protein